MRMHRRVNVAAQLAVAIFREADEWEAKGNQANAQRALAAARSQLVRAGMDSRDAAEALASESVPFTPAEETKRNKEEIVAGIVAAEREAAELERQKLIDKLTTGTASGTEVQQALVRLLGG